MAPAHPAAPSAAAPTPLPTPTAEKPKRLAVILALHSEDDAEALVSRLERNPDLKLTLLFPPSYFESRSRAALAPRFAALQAAKQIEIGLTLDNEPNLPLLADLKLAGKEVQKWGFTFAWPEDAASQTARGSGRYQKRWGQLPSGFAPPFGAVSDPVMKVLGRFRLSWVLARPSSGWGVRFFGGTALLVPEPLPIDQTTPNAMSPRDAARAALSRPFTYVDAGSLPTPDFERLFIDELGKAESTAVAPLGTAQEFVESLRNEYQLPHDADPFANDYSGWVESALQRRAWQALADARQVVETYKNSGRANLTRLDAAVEEMCNAESGPFLLSLADGQNASTFAQRNFLATVANVYRLCGVPVPEGMGTWFVDRAFRRPSVHAPENDRPFFVEGPQSLTWNDPTGDDKGDGTFTYPAGAYAKGTFDLRDLTVSWTDTEVTFAASVVDLPVAGSVAVVPLTDIYVDVNRLSDAGSTSVLTHRGPAVIDRDAAWEYAVVLTPRNAAVYQSLPGGEQRLLMIKTADVSGNTYSATFPRRTVRGEPRRWRLTVAAGGAAVASRDEAPTPISVQATADQDSFGGAQGPRLPPRYIDLLAPTDDVQESRIKSYSTGTVILPYVEAE